MAESLTTSYAHLFDLESSKSAKLRDIFRCLTPLARDVYTSGKVRELSSFAFWEVAHRARRVSRQRYLEFSGEAGVDLNQSRHSLHRDLTRLLGRWQLKATQSDAWAMLFDGHDEGYGCLRSEPNVLYRRTRRGAHAVPVWEAPGKIKSIFVNSAGAVFVAVNGKLYRSVRPGNGFRVSLDLSHPACRPRFPDGISETSDGTLVVGEYGNVRDRGKWRSVAYIYSSNDGGESWNRSAHFVNSGANKHIHLVYYSKLHDKLMVTDGDNLKRLWLGELAGPVLDDVRWNLATKHHIAKGGYTSVVEVGDTTFFGSDYLGGTNFIVHSTDCKRFVSRAVPDPYRRSPIMRLAPRLARSGNIEIWALLHSSFAGSARSLVMYSANRGKSWRRVLDYDGTKYCVHFANAALGAPDKLWLSVKDRAGGYSAYCIADTKAASQAD